LRLRNGGRFNRCPTSIRSSATWTSTPDYDAQIRRFIPGYDDMLATAVERLAALIAPTARVLDLGGGTGALSAAVLGGVPNARVTELTAICCALRAPLGCSDGS
jgi:methylase of polypeptide subunit release factors